MCYPAPVLENDTHKLLWDFDIQTGHLISARRPGLIVINKKKRTCKIVDFAVPAYHRITLNKCEKKDKYLDLARELKKKQTMEHEGDDYINWNWCFWFSHQRLLKGLEDWRLEDEWRPSKHQHYWERPEFWEESWRLEETCCHSNFIERPSANTFVQNSQGLNNNNKLFEYSYYNQQIFMIVIKRIFLWVLLNKSLTVVY